MAFPLTSIDGDVHWNGAQVEHASGWNLNLSNDGKTYVTNKTKGKVNRRPGNIDATGSFTVKSTHANNAILPGQLAVLKLYVDSDQFWSLTNALILSINPVVNIETGDIEGSTVNFAFAGADDASGGTILDPAGTTIDNTLYGYGS